MIITHLMGGMGNQMFQYAAGKELAIRFNVPLKLDISSFKRDPLRHYALDCYNIDAQVAKDDEIGIYKISKINAFCKSKPLLRNITDYLRNDNKKFFKEQCFQYDENIQQCSENTYLEGYWQCEKYFKKIEYIIRKDFTLKKELSPDFFDLANFLIDSNSVGIHIRRSDYVLNPSTNATHGTCTPGYYKKAIDLMAEHITNPFFLIFSDDPAWARQNVKSEKFPIEYIDYAGPDKDGDYIQLMSCCKNHIIANSTFSWWWAYLCSNPEKIVIAPKKWFNKSDKITTDLLPLSWIQL